MSVRDRLPLGLGWKRSRADDLEALALPVPDRLDRPVPHVASVAGVRGETHLPRPASRDRKLEIDDVRPVERVVCLHAEAKLGVLERREVEPRQAVREREPVERQDRPTERVEEPCAKLGVALGVEFKQAIAGSVDEDHLARGATRRRPVAECRTPATGCDAVRFEGWLSVSSRVRAGVPLERPRPA